MISEFFWIEEYKEENNEMWFKCELPDIEGDNDEFVQCGMIHVFEENNILKAIITLYNNFESLSEGESYEPNATIRDILINLKSKFGIYIDKCNVIINKECDTKL